ncbi:hypothetical protein E4T56_gene3480 [Termitomyces sp. T112]|nr:hypothetical protein E4T56_gene3480 [Termitomyces sp. T112]
MPDSFTNLDAAQESLIINFLHIAALSILFYDYLITSGDEVEYVWRRLKTKSTYLFFLNRYFAFFSNIAESVLIFKNVESERSIVFSPEEGRDLINTCRCKLFTHSLEIIIVCNQAIVCVLLSLRVYALYDRSYWVAWFIVGSAVVLIGISSWSLSGREDAPVAQQFSGCHDPLSHLSAIHQAAPWEALLVFDLILFVLTMVKTWRDRNEYPIAPTSVSLRYIVVRDGAIYFIIMGIANLTNILTFYLCGPILRGALSTFASVISNTMMSRLMLNLHKTANSGIYYTSRESQFNFRWTQAKSEVGIRDC